MSGYVNLSIQTPADECVGVLRDGRWTCLRPDHAWPRVLRIGCSHPHDVDVTALGEPARTLHCPGCGAWWCELYPDG